MNRIQAKFRRSKYSYQSFLVINVDGVPLDKILDTLYPEKKLMGLVPTMLDWLEDTKERAVVWHRIESEQRQVVPILMCPDDVDLWCTVVNVEVEKTEKSVKWLRIGIDIGDTVNMPDSIGSSVAWLDKIQPMEFERNEYENVVSEFKIEVEKSEIKKLIHLWINRIAEKEVIPKSIQAFNFGIMESEKDYQIYLVGANNYDTINDDWACEEDFVPKEKYLSLGERSKKWKWDEVQSIVKSGVQEFIGTREQPIIFIHTAKYLTTGFDSGELQRIELREY